MTSCLYECLCQVGLQSHYHRFAALGLQRAAQLSVLTMEDYPRLGVLSMEDRTRLFHLVQLVKGLHEDNHGHGSDEDDDDEDVGVETPSSTRRAPIRRQLDFSSEPAWSGTKHSGVRKDHRLHSTHIAHGSDVIRRLTDHSSQNRETPRSFSEHKQTIKCTTSALQRGSKLTNQNTPLQKEETNVYGRTTARQRDKEDLGTPVRRPLPTRVCDSPGYNYGLPLSSPVFHRKIAGKERIRVCVRKRPLTHVEDRRGEADVVTAQDGECVMVHETKESVDLTQYILQHRFYYDQVFGEDSNNEQVYQSTAYPLVQHLLTGGKATCFAYGQTGAGKTHTMLGSSPGRPGLYALAARDIFRHLYSSPTGSSSHLLVYVSFFEIYCGQLYDLLDHRKRLYAREDGHKVVQISGLRQVKVDSVSSLLEVVGRGTEERTQGVSGVNPSSSRSHALLQIQLRDSAQHVTGRMWFVDLAGSERAADTREPDRRSRMEGAEINQSLLALKECIRSLDQENSHTPFRQSKLTQVLRDSFVGDSKTCMIANISPSHLATEHTLNTLRYADRVKELKGTGSDGRGKEGGRRGRGSGSGRGRGTSTPKRNQTSTSSSSGGSLTRGTSPHKRVRLGRGRDSSDSTSPLLRLPSGGALLCSTPKRRGVGEGRGRKRGEDLGLELISPVHGTLGLCRAGREGAGEESKRRNDREGREDKQMYLNGDTQHGNREEGAALLTRQPMREEIDHIGILREGGASGGPSAGGKMVRIVDKPRAELEGEVESKGRRWMVHGGDGGRRREINAEGQRESNMDGGWVRETVGDTSGESNDERERSESERVMHLRRYHQQLQQFHPLSLPPVSPPLSASLPLSLSGSPPISSSVSPPLSVSSSISPSVPSVLQDVLTVYRAEARIRLKAEVSVGAQSMLGSGQEEASYRSEERSAWSDREERGMWLNSQEQRGPEDILLEEEWSTEEEDEGDGFAIRSTDSISDNNSLYPQPPVSLHLRAPAERPLSPADLTDTSPPPGKLNDLSLDLKLTNQRSNSMGLKLHNVSPGPRPSGVTLRETGLPWQPNQAAPSPSISSSTQAVSQGPQPPETHTHPGTGAQSTLTPSSGDGSICSMEPLSLSLLQVDQLAATTSFLTHAMGLTNPSSPVDTQRGGRAVVKLIKSETPKGPGVEEEERENEGGGLSLAELLGIKTGCLPSTIQASKTLEKANTHTLTTTLTTIAQHAQKLPTITKHIHQGQQAGLSHPARSSSLFGCPHQHVKTMEHVQWSVLQAHMDQLEEMELLCVREETLLSHQPQMDFVEYVQKLEKIMEKKTQCVENLRAHLKPHLLREKEMDS